MKRTVYFFLIVLLVSSTSFALPSGAVQLLGSDLRQVQSGATVYLCGKIGISFVPGLMLDQEQSVFLSYADKIKALKKKLKNANSSQEQKLKNSIKKFKAKKAAAEPLCMIFNNSGGDSNLPPNFDSLGNVTSAGKALFGIPQDLPADITTGKAIFTENCTGCHTDQGRLNRSFSNYREAIAQAPMFFNSQEVPDSMLAQITAYLNRFRP